jgi:hypothetical protein
VDGCDRARHAGVEQHDVQPTESLERKGDVTPSGVVVGDVGGQRNGVLTELGLQGLERGRIAIYQHHARTFGHA